MPSHLIDSLPTTAATPYPVVAFSGFEVAADESLMKPAVTPDAKAPAATLGKGFPVTTLIVAPVAAPTPDVQIISFRLAQPVTKQSEAAKQLNRFIIRALTEFLVELSPDSFVGLTHKVRQKDAGHRMNQTD